MRTAARFTTILAAAAIVASLGIAQNKSLPRPTGDSWSGYLVDKNCGVQIAKKDTPKAMEMAKKHSVACGLDEACMASGYGIIRDGQFIKFDDAGDKLAARYLRSLKKKNDVLVRVWGTLDESGLRVSQIKDAEQPESGQNKKG